MPVPALCVVCVTCPPVCACPHFGQNATPLATSPPHWLQNAIGCLPLRFAQEAKRPSQCPKAITRAPREQVKLNCRSKSSNQFEIAGNTSGEGMAIPVLYYRATRKWRNWQTRQP